ncbi:recombinase family protein [Actinotalea sp. JY-7876]|uniref:recombinase family protein n=1 Tax=Actinotalea sp. JY-7876 TaxID=2758442 RepID=UPI0015F73D68|nr:recombinase family protein [Actinotalea sp. JY-7876]
MPLYSKDAMAMNPLMMEALPTGAWSIPLGPDDPVPVNGRIRALFEVRESDESNELLFDAMREQTYQPYQSNPWVAAVLDAGMAPMHAKGSYTFRVRFPSGEVLELVVLIQRLVRGRTTVIRFQVGPFLHLWSMASAAKANAAGDNDFTQVLLDEVRQARPQTLVAANVSRLVRSDQEGGLLLKVLPDHVDQICAGPLTMKLVGENSEYGRMQFAVLGAMASMERNWIVTRLMTGRIAAGRRGEWLFGKTTVPFGYRLDGKRLVPVPELAGRVRQLLLVLGDDVSPALTVRRLAEDAVPMKRPRDDRTVGESARARNNPRALVDSFLAWVPLWVTGEYVWRFSSPLKGIETFAGAPVVYDDANPLARGEVQVLMTPGVPEGGWAEQALLERVAEVARRRFADQVHAQERSPDRPLADAVRAGSMAGDLHEAVLGPNNEHRRPAVHNPRRRGTKTLAAFSGYGWQEGNNAYELLVAPHGRYKIVERAPLPPATGSAVAAGGAATRPVRPAPSVTLAYVDEASMMRGFVRAFAEACASGVPVELRENVRAYRLEDRSHLIDERSLARERLLRELHTARLRLSNAKRSSLDATSETLRAQYVAFADAYAVEVEDLDRELCDLDQQPAGGPPPTFESATDVLLAAMATLVRGTRLTPEEHAALRILVPDVRLARDPHGAWTAEATVRMPVADGVAELGPIQWQVARSGVGVPSMRAARRAAPQTAESRAEARYRLEHDAGIAPEAARLLTAAPFPELAQLVLHARTGRALPAWLDEPWREPKFMAHVAATYGANPSSWTGPSLYGRRLPRAQAVVDCTATAGRLTLAGYRDVMPGVDANEMWVFARWHQDASRRRGPVVNREIAADGTWSLTNRFCRCGKAALFVVHAPEITGSLMCECGLTVDADPGSTADGVRFPDAYRTLRVTRDQWMLDLRRTCGPLHDELSEVSVRQASILQTMRSDVRRDWRAVDLAPVCGMSAQTCQWNLNQLRRREFVRSTGRPARFELVAPEDVATVLARSWRRRPTA